VFEENTRRRVFDFLRGPGWQFGWKSNPETDKFSFWHKHFAGNLHSDHTALGGDEKPYECADELRCNAPLLYELWCSLAASHLKDHLLVRCYANGQPYGSEGTAHTDSMSATSFTSVYYPYDRWRADWAGETVFFDKDLTDILTSVYPKPNRLVTFPGTVPHAARGVSRTCPAMRITLMFKTELQR
jgi:SM-20-related protein